MTPNMSVVLMDFSDIYRDFYETLKEKYGKDSTCYLDLVGMAGTKCCLDGNSQTAIEGIISDKSEKGFHILDSGNYHYLSLLWIKKIREEFALLLIDNHTDLSDDAFGNLLSCGSWVKAALSLPHLKHVYMLGVNPQYVMDASPLDKKVQVVKSASEIIEIQKSLNNLPVYISIDKDALCTNDAATDWDQGNMTLKELNGILKEIKNACTIIGTDICGDKSNYPSFNEIVLNNHVTECIIDSLREE